jgi:hypothetical protein
LAHDRIEGQTIRVVHILVSGQSSENRLPEQPVKPMERVLPSAAVSQRRRGQIRKSERVIELAHHQKPAIRTDLRTQELHPHTAVKAKSPITRFMCTLWVIHNPQPSARLTC